MKNQNEERKEIKEGEKILKDGNGDWRCDPEKEGNGSLNGKVLLRIGI